MKLRAKLGGLCVNFGALLLVYVYDLKKISTLFQDSLRLLQSDPLCEGGKFEMIVLKIGTVLRMLFLPLPRGQQQQISSMPYALNANADL